MDSDIRLLLSKTEDFGMTEKQKKMLGRIIAAFVLFVALLIAEHTGMLENVNVWIQFVVYQVPYLIIGYDIVYKAVRNISHGQVFDENFLMMVATVGAFGVQEFSEAVAVMLFYQVGELFQSYAVGKSRQSISAMMDICPEYANIEQNGVLTQVDPDDVEVGDIIVIKPGERIPLDGVVIEGESLVDTAALTGESVPRSAKAGDEIISGCVNGSGTLKVKVTKEFDDSTVAKILESSLAGFNGELIWMSLIACFGIIAGMIVAGLYVMLIWKIFRISGNQSNELGKMIGYGCGLVFAGQIVYSFLICLNIVPEMPVILPFLSYGGSGTLLSYILMGLVLSVYRYKNIPLESQKRKSLKIRISVE